MIIPIDAIQYGAGFDETGRWHKAHAGFLPVQPSEDDPMNPARGMFWGLLFSSTLWIGLIAAVRAVATLVVHP